MGGRDVSQALRRPAIDVRTEVTTKTEHRIELTPGMIRILLESIRIPVPVDADMRVSSTRDTIDIDDENPVEIIWTTRHTQPYGGSSHD